MVLTKSELIGSLQHEGRILLAGLVRGQMGARTWRLRQ